MALIDLTTLGFFAIIIGVVLIFLGIATQQKTKVESGGIIFIGPIPIFGATSERTLSFVIVATIIFLLLIVVLNLVRK